MIVLTGATGQLNGATARHLLERVPADQVVVTTRDPAAAQDLAALGVEVRRADYADAASLPPAFDGADQLLLVSSNDRGADTVALHRAAVAAAATVGVGRVLYTSHQGASADSPFGPARVHAATEDLLATSGLPWTALRNGFYAQTLTLLTGPSRETGRLVVPGDGKVSWTAREDLAEAAATLLAAGNAADGPTTLTASEALTFGDVADVLSDVGGRPVELVVVDPEDWVAAQVAAGQDERGVRFSLGLFEAAERGLFAGTGPLLAGLLGREPRTVRELLQPADDRATAAEV